MTSLTSVSVRTSSPQQASHSKVNDKNDATSSKKDKALNHPPKSLPKEARKRIAPKPKLSSSKRVSKSPKTRRLQKIKRAISNSSLTEQTNDSHSTDTDDKDLRDDKSVKQTLAELTTTVSQLASIVNVLVSRDKETEENRQQAHATRTVEDTQGSSSSAAPSNAPQASAPDPADFLFINKKTEMTGVDFTSGLLAGEHLPERIKLRIWSDKYVDFYNILYPDNEGVYNISLNTSQQTGLKLTPRKNRQLTEREWCKAFDVFLAVYTRKYPDSIHSLITYGKFIKEMMSQGHNWAYYDTRFRKDREFSKSPWTNIRIDLQLNAVKGDFRNVTFNNRTQTQSSSHLQTGFIPKGYCFAYHKQGRRCENQQCPWKHDCVRCSNKHPMFRHCQGSNDKFQNKQSIPRTFPYSNRANPGNANTNPNRSSLNVAQ